jgi:exodeoxyribonuclease V alpha subunit
MARAPNPTLHPTEELAGEVAALIFANPDTGFGVVELAGADGGRATGPLASLVPGQPVRLTGRWVEHERYGPTFEAVSYELTRPRTAAGLASFLASDHFSGVGPKLAERMVTTFGLDLGKVIENEPHRLAEVKGVSPALADTVAEAWREAGALAELVQRLAGAGVPPAVARDVHQRFGDRAGDLLDSDPYALLVVPGLRWAHAESLAKEAGIDRRDERRLAAGAATALRELRARGGHTLAPTADLAMEALRLLGVDAIDARRALDLAADRRALRADPLLEDHWCLPEDLAAEEGLAEELARLLDATSRVTPATGDVDVDASLTATQAAAVRQAFAHQVSVLTGGPGTGKTRTVTALVSACEAADLRVALCAPTGRAAKRMEELTGRGATTIHRLLEARGVPGEGFTFGYDASRRLPHDVIVADEWSMADTRLAWALVQAVDDGAHLLLVGDADQLPSVGAGAVLRDLLALADAGVLPATRLTEIHRQAASSRIVTLAHEINAGAVPVPQGRMGDVFAVPERSDLVADRVAEIVASRAPDYFGCAPGDVQVLAPMYRGPAGVDRLNERLKERLNPAGGRRAVGGFHEGDRVVQTRNDAELDVANGDIGEVVATDAGDRSIEVAFPYGTVVYDLDQARDLAPAWCLTVHKSQGGEWPVVVFVLDRAHRVMLWRELVYTGVTRAAQGLLLVGEPPLLAAAAKRTGSGVRDRRTGLRARVEAALGGNEA